MFDPKEVLATHAGAKFSVRNRRTGTVVTVYDGFEANIASDDEERWMTVCEDHATLVGHNTLRNARGWMAHPDTWCETCGEIAAKKGI